MNILASYIAAPTRAGFGQSAKLWWAFLLAAYLAGVLFSYWRFRADAHSTASRPDSATSSATKCRLADFGAALLWPVLFPVRLLLDHFITPLLD